MNDKLAQQIANELSALEDAPVGPASSSSSSVPTASGVLTAGGRSRNEAFIRRFRKENGVMKQSTLPSTSTAHSEWAIASGWSMKDAQDWRSLCEKLKFAREDQQGRELIGLVEGTISLANHCDSHPIGLLHFARVERGIPVWDATALVTLKSTLLPSDGEASDEGSSMSVEDDDATPPTGSKKRAYRDMSAERTVRQLDDAIEFLDQ